MVIQVKAEYKDIFVRSWKNEQESVFYEAFTERFIYLPDAKVVMSL